MGSIDTGRIATSLERIVELLENPPVPAWVAHADPAPFDENGEPPDQEHYAPGESLIGMYVQCIRGYSHGVTGKVFWQGPNKKGPGEAIGFKRDGEDQAHWSAVADVQVLR